MKHREEHVRKAMELSQCSRKIAIKVLDQLADIQKEEMEKMIYPSKRRQI